MKAKKTSLAMVLGAILTFACVACSDKNDPYNPNDYSIKVLDTEIDGNIKVKNNSDNSQTLTYNSRIWVMKNYAPQTRSTTRSGSDGDKIEIGLSNTFHFNVGYVSVANFEVIDKPQISTTLMEIGEKDAGNHILVKDSVMQYNINYGGFIIPCNLEYQVASYRGGYPTINMPHHPIETVNILSEPIVKDLGYQNIQLDSENTLLCLTKDFKASVAVVCNSTNYTGTINATLYKVASGDYLTGSSVVSQNLIKKKDGYYSSIVINQSLSDGTISDKTYETYVDIGGYRTSDDAPIRVSNKNNIAVMSSKYNSNPEPVFASEDGYVSKYCYDGVFKAKFLDFDVEYYFYSETPIYNDGFIRHEMPFIRVKDVKIKGDLIVETDNLPNHEFEGVNCYRYEIVLPFEAEYEGYNNLTFKEEYYYTRVIFVPAT